VSIDLKPSSTPLEYSISITPTNITNLGIGATQLVTATINTPNLISATQLQGISRITATINTIGTNDTVTDTTTLLNPNLILNAAAGDSLVSLGWVVTATGVTSYSVEYSVNNGPWTTLAITNSASADRYYHNPSTNGTTYSYQLKAYNTSGLIGYSNIATAIPGGISALVNGCTAQEPTLVVIGISGTLDQAGETECINELAAIDSSTIASDDGLVTVVRLVTQTNSLTLNYEDNATTREGIIDGPGYDLVLHTVPYIDTVSGQGILMAYTLVELAVNESGPWTTVFNWDGNLGGVDRNITAPYALDGEGDLEFITSRALLGVAGQPLWNTGITIDIASFVPAGIHYRYIRISSPLPLDRSVILDTIYREN
jgi:hypothetical protein